MKANINLCLKCKRLMIDPINDNASYLECEFSTANRESTIAYIRHSEKELKNICLYDDFELPEECTYQLEQTVSMEQDKEISKETKESINTMINLEDLLLSLDE